MLIYVQKVIYGRTDRQTQNYGSERNKMKIFKIDYSRYFMVKNGIYGIIYSKTPYNSWKFQWACGSKQCKPKYLLKTHLKMTRTVFVI